MPRIAFASYGLYTYLFCKKEFEITKVVVVVVVIDSTFCSSYSTCTCQIKDGDKTTWHIHVALTWLCFLKNSMYTHSLPPHQCQIMVNSVRVRPIKYYRGTQDNWKLQRWGMRVGEGVVGYRNPAEAVVEFFSHACSKYHTISPFLLLLFFNSRWTNYNLICTHST